MGKNYYTEQLDNALKGHNPDYSLTIQIKGTEGKSFNITCPNDLFLKIKDYYFLNGDKI